MTSPHYSPQPTPEDLFCERHDLPKGTEIGPFVDVLQLEALGLHLQCERERLNKTLEEQESEDQK